MSSFRQVVLYAMKLKSAGKLVAHIAVIANAVTQTYREDFAERTTQDHQPVKMPLGARSKTNFFVMMSMKRKGFPHAERARGTVQSCRPGFSLVDAPDNAMRVSRICTGVTCSAKEHGGTPLWLV